MSMIKVNNVELYYESVGSGPQTILFAHSYCTDHSLFKYQIEVFKERFRCISYDHRGHGKSEVTKDGYELDNLVTDLISLIEGLNAAPVHFVGVSVGGMIGMRAAFRRPDLMKSLTLLGATAEAESEEALKQYNLLLGITRLLGPKATVGQVMPLLFHDEFLEDESRQDEVKEWRSIFSGHNKKGLFHFGKGVFWRESVADKLPDLTLPTAVIAGDHDAVSPPEDARKLAGAILNAKLYTIPGAGHSAPVEKPAKVIDAMQDFYTGLGIL